MRADPICPKCGAPTEALWGTAGEDPQVVWVCWSCQMAWGQNWDVAGDDRWFRVNNASTRDIFYGLARAPRPGFIERIRQRLGLRAVDLPGNRSSS